MRRAAVSIPTNIAEGHGRCDNSELAPFLNIATGSARELEYQLLLACDLKMLDPKKYDVLNAEVQQVERMLAALVRRVEQERVVAC